MVIVDGEALGSILLSALTKTGKPRKDAPEAAGVITPDLLQSDDAGESAEKSAPTPAPVAKAAPAKPTPRKEGA